MEGGAAGQARAVRAAPRRGRARDAVHRRLHGAPVRRRDRRAVRRDHRRLPARQADPDPRAQRHSTHETFYILEGKVRLFFEDDGTKTDELLTPGDFAFVPAGTPHAYRVEEAARLTGTMTGGFERFFQHMGTLTDHATTRQPPFIPDFPRMQAAAQQHAMRFLPDYRWPTAGEDA